MARNGAAHHDHLRIKPGKSAHRADLVPRTMASVRRVRILPSVVVLAILAACTQADSQVKQPSVLRLFDGEAKEVTAAQCGPQLSIETPSCTVQEKHNGYELRQYPKGQIWVQTIVANSSYLVATSTGFYRCFYFISGQNEKKEDIEMTAPVLIKPVPQASGYSISFFAPSRFSSVRDLPKPNNPLLEFVVTKETVQAVLGPFGGFPGAVEYEKKWQELKFLLDRDGIGYDEKSVVYAGYSSPFEIFNRKQEVHVTIN